jgi:hypothetical protein
MRIIKISLLLFFVVIIEKNIFNQKEKKFQKSIDEKVL